MTEAKKYQIKLVLGWTGLDGTAKLRRNTTGFDKLKKLAEQAGDENPLQVNAFLYSFLCSAKNFNLFLEENTHEISSDVQRIAENMEILELFERDAIEPGDPSLRDIYLDMRKVAARPGARDEQRTLATLLFSGPSTYRQVAEDLGISENLAKRTLKVLSPVLDHQGKDTGPFVLRSDPVPLAVTLYLLRYRLGIDPIRVLKTRIIDNEEGVNHA